MSGKLEEPLFSEILENGYELTDIIEEEDRTIIEFKPEKHNCKCPDCGEESNLIQSTIVRTI